ncbi:MAG: AAA family ATPase [Spirosomataceae bacterium]
MIRYQHGLVFGKFLPVHQGHVALVDFAAMQCERLTVSMSVTPDDSIAPELRLDWLQRLFHYYPHVEIVQEPDDFHDPTLPLVEATRLWADFIRWRFPTVDVFFCSEEYGTPLAHHLGLPCVYFDKQRRQVPISATQLRANPWAHWHYIPPTVRPYFVKKICLFGPESTGKSTLSEALATYFRTTYVPEMARLLLQSNDITVADILAIGHAQTQEVTQQERIANKLLFCDTDVITTQIYAQHYLGLVPEVLIQLERQVHYDHYFLLDIDLPWVADNLRDLGHRRDEMFSIFKAELEKRQLPYTLISGTWDERFEKIKHIIQTLFGI